MKIVTVRMAAETQSACIASSSFVAVGRIDPDYPWSRPLLHEGAPWTCKFTPGEFVIRGVDVRGDEMTAASGIWRPD